MSSLSQYYRPRQIALGAAVTGIARRYGPSIMARYGPSAGRYVSGAVNGLASRVRGALSRQQTARSARVSTSRLRGRSRSMFGSTLGVQVPAGGGGESKSHTRLVRKGLNLPSLKLLGLNTVNRASGITASCAQGTQNVLMLGEYFNANDISNIFASVGQTTATYNAAKCVLIGIHAENLITNATSLNTHCTLYDVIARHDGFTTVNPDPVSVFQLGGADAGNGSASHYSVVGTTPWNNPRFVETYQIIKTTPLILAPGQTHTHTVTYKPNFLFNKELSLIHI